MNFINKITMLASTLYMENKAWQELLKETTQAHRMVRRNLIYFGEDGAQIQLNNRLREAEKDYVLAMGIVDRVRERLKSGV